MSDLPRGWVTSTVGAVNQFSGRSIDPRSTPSTEYELYSVPTFPTGKPELLPGNAIGSTKQTVEPNDVLVCKINPRINRVWTVGPRDTRPQIASSEWITVRAPSFDARFLRYYFASPAFRKEIEEGVTGVGGSLTRAQPRRVATFQVPVAPRVEQGRIGDKLDALLEQVNSCRERLNRVPQILKKFREAVLEAAISGRLTEEWGDRESNRSTQMIRLEDESIEVPASWRTCRLGDAIDETRPLCYGVVQPGSADALGSKVVRIQDMNRGRVAIAALRTVSKDVDEEYRRSRVRAGDVLISVVGTIGRTAIVPEGLVANIARAIARLAPANGVEGRWLRIWLDSVKLQWWLLRSAKEVARKTLNLSDLANTPLVLPGADEQTEIARRVRDLFDLADGLERQCENASGQVGKLTPSILSKAFRGELVPQDPNNEPASVLLERIRAEQIEGTSERNEVGASQKKRRAVRRGAS